MKQIDPGKVKYSCLQSGTGLPQRELQSLMDSLGRLGSPPWDPGSGLATVAPQSCFSSEKPPERYYSCYKFPREKGAMARNGQSLGARVEKRRQLLTSLTNRLSNQPWLFWLLAPHVVSEQVLPPSAHSIFTHWIYFIIFSSCAQGPPSGPTLCLYLSPSCYLLSISSVYTFNSLWDCL